MLFYLILLYPILEIAAFILVAKAIGWASTLLLALATSFIGAALLRANAGTAGLAQNSYSARSIENYLFVNLGCFLLILPGFITDVLGLALTIPPARAALIRLARLCRFDVRTNASGPFSVFRAYRFGNGADFRDFTADFRRGDVNGEESIDVETVLQNDDSNENNKNGAKNALDDDGDEPIDVEYTIRK